MSGGVGPPQVNSESERLVQLDGNVSILSDNESEISGLSASKVNKGGIQNQNQKPKNDKISAALNLPIIATYNLRSLIPKIKSLKNDIFERGVDLAFLQEVWEQTDSQSHQFQIEKLLEIDGLQYISNPRPKNDKGKSYGGVAIVVNQEKFTCEKLDIKIPNNLEVVWGLVKPKNQSAKFKKVIACSFYSPPDKKKNSKLADHIVTTLHMLYTRYPESAIILGADKNDMNISPILCCGLKLRQIVDKCTRKQKILDILIMNTSGYYKSPIIAPPIQPDDPLRAQPSDHSVPVCVPHTDRYKPPERSYRIIRYRPLPESGLRRFGEWIVGESWDSVSGDISATEQAQQFENLVLSNLNKFCPEKEIKLGPRDKPFITAELKKLSRQKNREYLKRGKSEKYSKLKSKFDDEYKKEASKYLEKSLEGLREAKPGQAFNILKRLGAKPGDCSVLSSFSIPAFESENLNEEQVAERLAEYFSEISAQFPPLSPHLLPTDVQEKLQSHEKPPIVTEYDVYRKICAAKKPRTGIPGDLPKLVTQEFSPELSAPVSRIINSMFQTYEWPSHWKIENVIPIAKVSTPESEDDIRPISLTPFYSKVAEHFVVSWLLEFIGHKLDFRQYGGLKGNSITHYVIEFVNFILSCQDSQEQTAVLACMVDFSKAFNRQDHNILLTKLSDLGVPGWLLKIVISFLENRKMLVKYQGKASKIKAMPGGGPQGTLLALILFIVMINDIGFEDQKNNAGEIITSKRNLKIANEIHLKFVDDLTLAEAVILPEHLVEITGSSGAYTLPKQKSKVFKQLEKIRDQSVLNKMKLNYKKTKLMMFNPCKSLEFTPEINIEGNKLEVVEEIKLLGLVIRSDMRWVSNTKNMVLKASKRLWILKRLKFLGARTSDLIEVYTKQIRCILELAAPAWQGGISQAEKQDIERIQKCAAHIILGPAYSTYQNALDTLQLDSLENRRNSLALKFAIKCEKHVKFQSWFKRANRTVNTRAKLPKYCDIRANHTRFEKSPLSFLTKILNMHYMSQ